MNVSSVKVLSLGDPTPSLQLGFPENSPKFSLEALEAPPLPASSRLPPAHRHSNPHISQQPTATGFLWVRLCPSPRHICQRGGLPGLHPSCWGVAGSLEPSFPDVLGNSY